MLRESLLLHAWESGQGQSPAEQALCLLQYGYPERPLAQLLSLSVGERDALLFALREQSFGPNLQGAARCPQCRQQSQFSVPLAALRVPLLVTSSHQGQWLHQASLPWPCAWVLGHEGQGVDAALAARAAQALRIAQPGGEESLNVAAAAAICLHASALAAAAPAPA